MKKIFLFCILFCGMTNSVFADETQDVLVCRKGYYIENNKCVKCPGSGTTPGESRSCSGSTDPNCKQYTINDCTIVLDREDETGTFDYNNISTCTYQASGS